MWMDGNDVKGPGARLLLQPQEVRPHTGPDMLPERAPAARNNSLTVPVVVSPAPALEMLPAQLSSH